MKVYPAGPMRSIPQFNFPAFDAGTEQLRAMGIEVFSPAERDRREDDFDPSAMSGTDEELVEVGFSLRDALGDDLEYICKEADAVVVLPGWERSSGAKAEVATAKALSLPVYELDDIVGRGVDRAIDISKQPDQPIQVKAESFTVNTVPDTKIDPRSGLLIDPP